VYQLDAFHILRLYIQEILQYLETLQICFIKNFHTKFIWSAAYDSEVWRNEKPQNFCIRRFFSFCFLTKQLSSTKPKAAKFSKFVRGVLLKAGCCANG
jgi:hypothetical protein